MSKTKRQTIGEALARLREDAGMTRNALAVKAGINSAYLMRLENGSVVHPSFRTVEKLSDALGVSLEHFQGLTWPEEKGK